MNYYIIIPTYNEEKFVSLTLQSLVEQTILPSKVVVVNDNSTDKTEEIVLKFVEKYPWISIVNKTSDAIHLPGSKVIQAFQKGYETVDDKYDIIVKVDSDLIFPKNYFESIINHFKSDERIGMVGGFCYIETRTKNKNSDKKNRVPDDLGQNETCEEKNDNWVLENLTDKDHIRGALKAYRKETFKQIGGLKPAMGWDTVDELLCKFYNWKIVTDESLHVKHLKPTGANYNKAARYKQGEAFYTLGYGFWITAIASAKLAMMKKKPLLFIDYISGFWKAKSEKKSFLVTDEQAKFIRNYRLQKIKEKLF
ncbi:glycosyltransferase family 2 protein [Flavobacterium sp. SUN052]|uniref:glycosyltransferase n=1 Tax=Flavobacterium sp. SUN052 TaxID=3002441 RepID=UPI00237DDA5C|nr:glycosyltransferase family 2 protein [Flavobacterium sp. SUN052]MEC4004535.1 glycosyltransferase family 2 protein [Flavobacterium sp. SUN052]